MNTSICREVPGWIQAFMKPFFALSIREPDEVARQVVELLLDPDLKAGHSYFANKTGCFPVADYGAGQPRAGRPGPQRPDARRA